ncbi:hypothetical protein BWGOE4_55240 [Bacillus mycoides]|uniref:4'-phosphopantetheinyl transferase domain-containing protein n=1 Tax=Bacillus mycoides TaxID=1405 RepID=A0A1E8BEG6_BACMY|nr:hypothetical protein [Bacillus mycoides]OFD52989.1 hypothetical protein BWGOE4_55240 [Bacillus mycoides]OFD55578.1 hypothetical protein BWGOE7_56470 [Bacillus mycoides]OFD87021.1 hypothetical protein BWGOE11_57670 [Bacillus mycoides]OFD87090.1 hypothetical protein BWGOE12_57870 [Bacillus mycoides]OFD87620.1 hypothetical protein BWGOE13_57000 [Bacillus mycoides]
MKVEIQDLWDNLVFHYEQTEEFQLIILDNKKVEYMWDNYNTSLLKILHKKDLQYATSNGRFIERIGARLAVKLAYNKFYPKENLTDIFIQSDTRGAPSLWYQTHEIKHVVISLTHIPNYSGACLHSINSF